MSNNSYLTSEENRKLTLITAYRPRLAELLGLKVEDVFPIENGEVIYDVEEE